MADSLNLLIIEFVCFFQFEQNLNGRRLRKYRKSLVVPSSTSEIIGKLCISFEIVLTKTKL